MRTFIPPSPRVKVYAQLCKNGTSVGKSIVTLKNFTANFLNLEFTGKEWQEFIDANVML